MEWDAAREKVKVNPLARWTQEQYDAYIAEHGILVNPLVYDGYPSIGCAPCTSPVKPGEDPRSGRWRGSAKTECGIHFIGGKIVRGPVAPEPEPAPEVARVAPVAHLHVVTHAEESPTASKDNDMTTADLTQASPAAASAADAPVLVRDDGFHPLEGQPDVSLPSDTDPDTRAPSDSACALASSRDMVSRLPVKTTVLPETSEARAATT